MFSLLVLVFISKQQDTNSFPVCSHDSFLFINLINPRVYSLQLFEIYFFVSMNYSFWYYLKQSFWGYNSLLIVRIISSEFLQKYMKNIFMVWCIYNCLCYIIKYILEKALNKNQILCFSFYTSGDWENFPQISFWLCIF